MAAKKQTIKKTKSEKVSVKRNLSSNLKTTDLLKYFREGESYTSLILGIVVVIIASILLLSLFKTRPDSQKGTTSISTIAEQVVTITPTPTLVQLAVDKTTGLGEKTDKSAQKSDQSSQQYTIVSGDDLWDIAVKTYGDGYKWVDIARANNLSDPGLIHTGNKLIIPSEKSSSVAKATSPTEEKVVQPAKVQDQTAQKITGTSYTIVSGDDLWNIAVRAYGDGYKWVDIAKANNLTDPNLIFSGNILKLPR